MEQEILNVFIGQGAWCLLCVLVLYYNNKKANIREDLREERYNKVINDNRKDSKDRESKYQETINKLTDRFGIIDAIKSDVDYIKDMISR